MTASAVRVLVLSSFVLVLTGCEQTIDSAKGERAIAKAVRAQVGADVKSVSCPKDVVAKKGDTFECEVTGADGTKGTAVVRQKDAKGNIRFDAPFVHVGRGETFIQKQVNMQVGADIESVQCPDIVIAKKGGRFDCEVTGADGTTGTANVTETDADGNVDFDASFLHTSNLENILAGEISQQVGGKVELDCPEIVTGDKGGTFDCDATDEKGNEAKVKVTQKDDTGNVSYKVQQ